MKAYQLFVWKTQPRLVDIPQPEAGPNQVLVKVGGNGLCHGDLNAADVMTCSPAIFDKLRRHEIVGHAVIVPDGH